MKCEICQKEFISYELKDLDVPNKLCKNCENEYNRYMQNEQQANIVTRDMAIDAGDMDLEGTEY